jgi:hypothetical protein
MHSIHVISGLAVFFALGCGAAQGDSEQVATSDDELGALSQGPSSRAPLKSKRSSLQPAAPLSVSCEQPVQLPRGSSTTTTCTVSSALEGTVDVMVRGVPPEYSATMLSAWATVPAGGAVSFPVGINTTDQATNGLVMLRVEHSALQEHFYDAIEVAPQPSRRSVRVVHVLPSDAAEDYHATFALDRAARHLQVWMSAKLGSSTLVLAHDPSADHGLSVASVRLPREAAAYGELGGEALLREALAASGAVADDPRHVWVLASGIAGASGSKPGVALLGAEALGALLAPAEGDACGGVGALGAAIVQAATGVQPAPAWSTYPAYELNEEESAALSGSDIVSAQQPAAALFDCSVLAPL